MDKAFVSGKYTMRSIALRFEVNYHAARRHFHNHVPENLTKVAEKRDLENAQKVMDRLVERTTEVEKLLAACDEYLQDPDDPSKYFLGPRAENIEVIYLEEIFDGDPAGREPGASYRQKALLSQLLDRTGKMVIGTHWKHADPRKLILEAARTLEGVLLTLSKIAGYVKPADKITNVQVNIMAMLPNVMATLDKFPEAKQAVLKTLEKARAIKDANAGAD